MDKQLLRVLIVDESPDDAEQAANVLRKAGYMLKTQRVQDAAGLQAELGKGQLDLVLSELQLKNYKAAHALDAMRRAGVDLPFIVLTRRVSEDDIARIMRAGAHDVIIKDEAGGRLSPAVERELAAQQNRLALKAAQQNLKELEEKHRALVGTSREAICYSQDGMHIDANRAYLALFGYEDLSELEGVPFLNLVAREDHKPIKDYFRKAGGAAAEPQGFTAVNRQGQQFPAEISISSISINGETCQQIVVSDISKRKAAEQKLLYLSQRDPMTGLYNRHHFLQELGKAVDQARTGKMKGVLLHVDVEQLAGLNRELGLDAGDRFLMQLAKLLRERLREEDVVARLGGDEFVALMPGVTQPAAQALADDLAKAIAATPVEGDSQTRSCSCSMKVTTIDASVVSVQQILSDATPTYPKARAPSETPAPAPQQAPAPAPVPAAETPETATAAAPAAPAPARPVPVRGKPPGGWQLRIDSALAEGRVHLVFQPIVSLHAEPAEYYEVLVRLSEEGRKDIPAGEFIAAAEESGQAQQIDRLVVQRATEKLAILQPRGKQTTFFINVSVCTLRDPQFLVFLAERLKSTGVNGRFLVFEINDSALGQYPGEAEQFIRTVKRLGCELAVDDFTPARAAYVQQHPFAFLKISGDTVCALASDVAAQHTLQAISGLAKAQARRMIAKSVESAESLSMLWRYEIDYVQGNYFQIPAAQLGYDFNIESISSDEAVSATWAPAR